MSQSPVVIHPPFATPSPGHVSGGISTSVCAEGGATTTASSTVAALENSPLKLELDRLRNALREKDRELCHVRAEVQTLQQLNRNKDEALVDLSEQVESLNEKLRATEKPLEAKVLEAKTAVAEKKGAIADQAATETNFRRLSASNKKESNGLALDKLLAPLEAEIKILKCENARLQEDKRTIYKFMKIKDAALVDAEMNVAAAEKRANTTEDLHNTNQELLRRLGALQDENRTLDRLHKQKMRDVEKLNLKVHDLQEAVASASGEAGNALLETRKEVQKLQKERKTLQLDLARAKAAASRVAIAAANRFKDDDEKVVPVKRWLEDRHFLQGEVNLLRDKLAHSERLMKSESQLKERLRLRLEVLEEAVRVGLGRRALRPPPPLRAGIMSEQATSLNDVFFTTFSSSSSVTSWPLLEKSRPSCPSDDQDKQTAQELVCLTGSPSSRFVYLSGLERGNDESYGRRWRSTGHKGVDDGRLGGHRIADYPPRVETYSPASPNLFSRKRDSQVSQETTKVGREDCVGCSARISQDQSSAATQVQDMEAKIRECYGIEHHLQQDEKRALSDTWIGNEASRQVSECTEHQLLSGFEREGEGRGRATAVSLSGKSRDVREGPQESSKETGACQTVENDKLKLVIACDGVFSDGNPTECTAETGKARQADGTRVSSEPPSSGATVGRSRYEGGCFAETSNGRTETSLQGEIGDGWEWISQQGGAEATDSRPQQQKEQIEEYVPAVFYETLQYELLRVRRSFKEKDQCVKDKDDAIEMLSKKVELLKTAMSVEARRLKRENSVLEKEVESLRAALAKSAKESRISKHGSIIAAKRLQHQPRQLLTESSSCLMLQDMSNRCCSFSSLYSQGKSCSVPFADEPPHKTAMHEGTVNCDG
ncbi:hypothetical protein CBR_g4681 [Chara braunii]|uniref:Uncharacterized protein n=1 Tax=Chara braunii TaxID=69332 RepID=A0A388KIH5_CHABU|nr:hypothetical protein CBR_g4681 [Chara braunii]|eukprot:GBG69854.1 hypothetical protein CBR_g4681 [Chara braunii]